MNRKTILCAIDFSEASLPTLKWALRLAQLMQAHVTVMFCYRLITSGDDEETSDLKRRMESEAVKKFNEIEKKLMKSSIAAYQFVTEVGFFSYRIETFIRNNQVNLLVMENSIIQNFDEYKNLSFEVFLKNSKVPVLIVPQWIEVHHQFLYVNKIDIPAVRTS